MKKSILLGILVLFTCALQANSNPTKILTLEGKFISEKKVTCDIFIVTDSVSIQIESEKFTKFFYLELEEGSTYLLKFIAEDGTRKHLLVTVTKGGYFQVDVDFSNDRSAELSYDRDKSDYHVNLINDKEKLYAGRQRPLH